MENKRILLVEDNEASRKLLKEVALSMGLEPVLAGNGMEALDLFKKTPFPVVVTDLEMPEMDGSTLIDHLKDIDQEPVIIVQTIHRETSIIIDIMKKGVYDYVIKPIDIGDFGIKIERAFEAASLKRMQKIVDKERIVRLERELEWYKWYDSTMNREIGQLDRSLFHSLHTSFNQGAGFGALLTLLDIVSTSAKKENDHYLLDANLMDLIRENVGLSNKVLQTFASIDWLLSHDLSLETVDYNGLYDFINDINVESTAVAGIAGQTLHISDHKPALKDLKTSINREHLKKAVVELITNACKFSEKNTAIYLFIDRYFDSISFSVINKPVPDEEKRTGIPLGYENIVFEPFFRMSKNVFEGYNTLDYGLGLTLVDKIVKKHNAKASISNIMDYSELSHEPETKVMATIYLPLLK